MNVYVLRYYILIHDVLDDYLHILVANILQDIGVLWAAQEQPLHPHAWECPAAACLACQITRAATASAPLMTGRISYPRAALGLCRRLLVATHSWPIRPPPRHFPQVRHRRYHRRVCQL
jgi:hypothetical protein